MSFQFIFLMKANCYFLLSEYGRYRFALAPAFSPPAHGHAFASDLDSVIAILADISDFLFLRFEVLFVLGLETDNLNHSIAEFLSILELAPTRCYYR